MTPLPRDRQEGMDRGGALYLVVTLPQFTGKYFGWKDERQLRGVWENPAFFPLRPFVFQLRNKNVSKQAMRAARLQKYIPISTCANVKNERRYSSTRNERVARCGRLPAHRTQK